MPVLRNPQWPLSGGDRKALAKAIRQADLAYREFTARAQRARSAARDHDRLADLYECEAWNAQIFQGGPLLPSPTLGQALNAGCDLEIECRGCGAVRAVDLTIVRRPKTFLLANFEGQALACTTCRSDGRARRWKPRGRVVGMVKRRPPAAFHDTDP